MISYRDKEIILECTFDNADMMEAASHSVESTRWTFYTLKILLRTQMGG